jgi:hypothetical protein
VVLEMHDAASILGTIDARHRQLTETQLRSATGSGLRVGIVAGLAVIVVVVVAALLRRPLPTIAVAAVGAAVVAWLVRAARLVRRGVTACYVAGKPLCRVCGDALGPPAAFSTARCHYCAADNLLDPSAGAPVDATPSIRDRVVRAAGRPGRS